MCWRAGLAENKVVSLLHFGASKDKHSKVKHFCEHALANDRMQ
jgi:hypothetical protein